MNPVSAAYRQQTLKVRAGTYRDMLAIWPAFNPDNPTAYRAWATGASAIARRDRERFAVLAQQYVLASAAAQGLPKPRLAPAEAMPAEQLATSLRVTSLVAYAKARGVGRLPAAALRVASVASSGAVSRLALNGGRSVIQQTAKAGSIRGSIRVGNPQCDFCKVLLGRFYPPSTTDFKCHDHCTCSFEPVF